jgi:hypothetical protein
MAVSGTYTLTIKTPMGSQDGEMTLRIEENILRGTLSNSAGSSDFTGDIVDGNKVQFNTKIKTPLGRMKAQVSGTVEGNVFSGSAALPLGIAEIYGVRKV